jgi:cytoskeletal protein RodZ
MTAFVDFGHYLRNQRQLRGLSIEAVAKATKIPPTLLDALEEGQTERFPERVFVQNYIRSYATAVGLSADDALNRFHEMPGSPQPEPFDPVALEVARRERAVTLLWVTIAGTLLVVAGLAFEAMYQVALRFTQR